MPSTSVGRRPCSRWWTWCTRPSTSSSTRAKKKVMANTLKPNLLDPKAKPEEMKDVDKIRFFIRMTLLGDAAYDVLKKLYLRPEPPTAKGDGGSWWLVVCSLSS